MSRDSDPKQLITEAKQGDQLALQRLLVLNAADLSRFIASKLPLSIRSRIGPEDILQQAFMGAYRDIPHFRGDSPEAFAAWLRAIAEHRLQDAIRASQRAKRHATFAQANRDGAASVGSLMDPLNLLTGGRRSPSGYATRDEAVQAVQRAVSVLPEDYQQAVQLRFLEGRSLDEVADIMQRSPRSVQGLLDRAKKKMREALESL